MVKKFKYRLLLIIFILICWELLAKSGFYNKLLIPTLGSIFSKLISELLNGKLLLAIIHSFIVILKALLISLFFTFIFVSISRLNEIIDDLIDFLISIFHPIPGIAILPLVIMWFGIGEKAILFVIVHSMIWPMLISIKTEIKRLENKYSKIGLVFNFNKISEILNIYFFGSIPSIISGSKIAWSRGWRAFISSEMVFGVVGTSTGLGWYLFEQRVYMNSPALYSGLIAIIACGIFIESFVFNKLESITKLRWSTL